MVKPEFDLKELPQLPGAKPERVSLDAFKVGAAKLIAGAWGADLAKVYAAVDVGKQSALVNLFDVKLTVAAKKGADLSVAIPRFYKKDQADWGNKVVDAVSRISLARIAR